MNKILISGCLLGMKVRYHGDGAHCHDALLSKWQAEGRLVPVCPEVEAGLPIPRPPCEIQGAGGGDAVLSGKAKVISNNGLDRTSLFISGAEIALQIAKDHNIKIAVLKSNSPSCGNVAIYDGTYSGNTIPGMGTTAALLVRNHIRVFNETQLEEAELFLLELEK